MFRRAYIVYHVMTVEGGVIMADGFCWGSGFALIVVLFILLIIVGSAYIW
ncbi:hypothetical protein B4099_3110 [Heyndrickxia coagulans]|uniref:Sporulation protein YjcZ n=1 Tax=Heyndrickxia coagulans TaxID=1398 RepID=A0A150KFT8_HEYCO|nr:hypothetical protein B4099_3110 [Heyndrickxia coagulans]